MGRQVERVREGFCGKRAKKGEVSCKVCKLYVICTSGFGGVVGWFEVARVVATT